MRINHEDFKIIKKLQAVKPVFSQLATIFANGMWTVQYDTVTHSDAMRLALNDFLLLNKEFKNLNENLILPTNYNVIQIPALPAPTESKCKIAYTCVFDAQEGKIYEEINEICFDKDNPNLDEEWDKFKIDYEENEKQAFDMEKMRETAKNKMFQITNLFM